MSFNKKHVPQLEELRVRHLDNGDNYLLPFEKADFLIGPTESIDYIYKHLKRINGTTESPNTAEFEEVLVLLNDAHTRLLAMPELSLACSEIKKVINYITIKQ
jgi:hypothetical protein